MVHFLAVLGQELETVSCDQLGLKRSVPRNSFVQLRWIMCLSTSPVQRCTRVSPKCQWDLENAHWSRTQRALEVEEILLVNI